MRILLCVFGKHKWEPWKRDTIVDILYSFPRLKNLGEYPGVSRQCERCGAKQMHKDSEAWTTLDGRVIPLKYMTTTHVGNALTHQTRIFGKPYEPLLEEWTKRETEGIWAKASRFIGRVLGNYYKGSAKFGKAQKAKFKELNNKLVAEKKQQTWEFEKAIQQANDGDYESQFDYQLQLPLKPEPINGPGDSPSVWRNPLPTSEHNYNDNYHSTACSG